jgi:hypothetical protein
MVSSYTPESKASAASSAVSNVPSQCLGRAPLGNPIIAAHLPNICRRTQRYNLCRGTPMRGPRTRFSGKLCTYMSCGRGRCWVRRGGTSCVYSGLFRCVSLSREMLLLGPLYDPPEGKPYMVPFRCSMHIISKQTRFAIVASCDWQSRAKLM